MSRLPSEQRPPRGIRVEIICRSGCRPPDVERVARVARWILRTLGRRGEVSLLFTAEAEIRGLNRKFRGLDRSTDVLSFPWKKSNPGDGYLGDIAISLPTARKYANQAGWRLDEELQFLVLHGLLHLLGYDHETDSGSMYRLQTALGRKLLGREIPRIRTGSAQGSAGTKSRPRPVTRRTS